MNTNTLKKRFTGVCGACERTVQATPILRKRSRPESVYVRCGAGDDIEGGCGDIVTCFPNGTERGSDR